MEDKEKKKSDEKQRRVEMTKRTAEKAQETPKNTRGGMLDCAWMLLLVIGTNLQAMFCFTDRDINNSDGL